MRCWPWPGQQGEGGRQNVAFLKGDRADPTAGEPVDVVISNCVINLSADKGQVLREACRVLKPGGRFAVSDVIADGPVPEALRRSLEAWVGCLAARSSRTRMWRCCRLRALKISGLRSRGGTRGRGRPGREHPARGWEAGDGKLASAFVPPPSRFPRPCPRRPRRRIRHGCCGSSRRLLRLNRRAASRQAGGHRRWTARCRSDTRTRATLAHCSSINGVWALPAEYGRMMASLADRHRAPSSHQLTRQSTSSTSRRADCEAPGNHTWWPGIVSAAPS